MDRVGPHRLDIEVSSEIGLSLRSYWQGLHKKGVAPSRADIEPLEIPGLLPHLLLLDVIPEPLDFRYRLIGTHIVSRSVSDYTGQLVSNLPGQQPPSVIWNLYEKAYMSKKPCCMAVPQLNIPETSVEIQALPLSADGRSVNMLIGSVVFPESEFSKLEDPAL